jgi:hypothetical protein
MFDKYFKLPLKCDDYGVYVWTYDKRVAMDWMEDIRDYDKARIVDQINQPVDYEWEYEALFEYDGNCHILYDTHPLLRVRGWGMLTGVGGYNLSPKDAARIEDDFAIFIVGQLNKFGKNE